MDFIDGNIVRIDMKDFLTFDNMEVRPKPHLNVIIGPNGTGKSTIMCGLALALCFKPAITGRGKEVHEYVKHGRETATIEVEIFRKQGRNLVIKRVISRGRNSSQFFVQGHKASFKEVEANLKELHIQLDNLCQYLPQDRVVEFAKMNNVQLLEATEKTVGGQSLYELHEAVRNSGGAVQQIRAKLQQIQTQLQAEKDKNSSVEAEVRNHEIRKGLEVEIEQYKTRRLWFLYNQQRASNLLLREEKTKIKVELDQLKESWQPEADQIQSFQQQADEVKNRIKREERLVSSISSEISNQEMKWPECEEQRLDALSEYQGKESRYNQHLSNLQDLQKQLAAIEGEVQRQQMSEVDEASLQKTINDLTVDLQTLSSKMTAIQHNMAETINIQANQLRSLKQVSDHLERLQDTTRRRMQLLQQRHAHAYNAAMWLQKNTHHFKDEVYPPICTQLNVLNPDYASYVEDRIPRQDLIAFVCKNRDDVNLLKRMMDQQKWAVNIVHSGSDNLNEFKPHVPVEQIRKAGFDKYLLDAIEGPPAILHYLCKSYALHNIPVALRESVVVQGVPKQFPRFYIGNTRYHRNVSRYSGDEMTNLSTVQRPTLLTVTLQTGQLEMFKNQQFQYQNEAAASGQLIQNLKDEDAQLALELEEKRKKKASLVSQRNHRKGLLTRLEQKKEQIKRTERDKIDLSAAASTRDQKLKAITKKSLELLKSWSDMAVKQSSAKHSLTRLRSLYKSLSDAVTDLTAASQEKEERMRQKELEFKEAVERVIESSRAGRATLDELLKALSLTGPEQIDVSVREKFSSGIQGLEQTEQKLTELEAHRDCLVTADAQVVAEYNKRKKLIDNLTNQVERYKDEEKNSTDHMSQQRADWLSKVAKLTSTINGSFSKLMARMKCAGEVKLSKPENEDDLGKYGLSICVKFRGSEKLRELTAQQQSGGERAVSTALYLLALQTMSSVPFRCADEINQGMDAENERQMFTMLVEHMTDKNASQYFLVTPKLLPSLPYNDRVNFICVFNGPKISTQISIKEVFKRRALMNKGKKSKRSL